MCLRNRFINETCTLVVNSLSCRSTLQKFLKAERLSVTLNDLLALVEPDGLQAPGRLRLDPEKFVQRACQVDTLVFITMDAYDALRFG